MLYVSSDVIQAIDRNIGRFAAERGGILGGRKTNEIDTFYFDELAILLSNNNKYIPSVNDLNAVLLDWQKKKTLNFMGLFIAMKVGKNFLQLTLNMRLL